MARKFLPILALIAELSALQVEVTGAGRLGEKPVREAVLEAGPANAQNAVKSLYYDEGYLFTEVAVSVDSARNYLKVAIEPGPRATINSYNIKGFPGEPPRLILEVGRPFRRRNLSTDMNSIVTELENRGFPFAEASIESLEIGSPSNGEIPVAISISVARGDSVAIGAVIIPAGAKTKENVIRRTMLIRTPETYSRRRVEAGLKRVDKLGFVRISGEPELLLDDNGEWVLRLGLAEGRSILANGVLGYAPRGSNKGLSGQIEGTIDNIWGTGRRLAVFWSQTSDEYLRFNANFVEPFLFGGFGALNTTAEFYYKGDFYTQRTLSLEYRYPVSFALTLAGGASYRTILPDSAGESRFAKSSEWRLDLSLLHEGLWPRINSSEGMDVVIKASPTMIERSGPSAMMADLAESEFAVRLEGGLAIARVVGRSFVAFERIEGRSALSKGELPLPDLFLLGGWGSLRGYREEQFSAPHLFWSNSELRAMIGGDAHIFGFFDAGAIFSYNEGVSAKIGYGLGLRLSTAIGRWTVAYGVAGGEPPTDGLIHVGLRSEL